MNSTAPDEFDALEARLRTLLPEVYRDRYEEVQPVSMGSAGLKFAPDGRVAWDEIWGSFCDLAMAGGPPHRGTLLTSGSPEEIAAQPERYNEVVAELCRGVALVTGLHAEPAAPGWVRMYCTSAGMAGWLARALVMENISARFKGLTLDLPAGPAYGLEKEIKNVVTATAKTTHYWLGHMSDEQHDAIASLFRVMERESPLIQPEPAAMDPELAKAIEDSTGLLATSHGAGWLSLECGDIRAAVWMMRMLVASNVLARREGTAVYAPISEGLARNVVRAHRLAVARGILPARVNAT
ncbi:hypothetical protein SAMN05421770_107242 [Granulicella rosea]|uniref:Uncharacterized protein n=1 Tax=Granulicella rosea TaxID=474952 RepID=A0A239LU91_9BACT|nr:hypothetical protein [Granulicella rosea]SNT33194.1 hypothetical protein SAMN05421770_107242 [Granulicella rosea]